MTTTLSKPLSSSSPALVAPPSRRDAALLALREAALSAPRTVVPLQKAPPAVAREARRDGAHGPGRAEVRAFTVNGTTYFEVAKSFDEKDPKPHTLTTSAFVDAAGNWLAYAHSDAGTVAFEDRTSAEQAADAALERAMSEKVRSIPRDFAGYPVVDMATINPENGSGRAAKLSWNGKTFYVQFRKTTKGQEASIDDARGHHLGVIVQGKARLTTDPTFAFVPRPVLAATPTKGDAFDAKARAAVH